MTNIGEELKKIFLAGVGAVAVTAEKSKEIVEELVKKGELTVEQGKVLNEELKQNVKQKGGEVASDVEHLLLKMEEFSQEELEKVRKRLAELEENLKK